MYDSVPAFLNSHNARVGRLIDRTFNELIGRDWSLAKFMPVVNYDSIHLFNINIKTTPTVAFLVGDTQQVPDGTDPVQFSTENIKDLRIATARYYTGEDLKTLHHLGLLLQSSLPADRKAAETLKMAFVSRPAQLVSKILAMSAIIQCQVHSSGKCLYRDPITNFKAQLDYTSDIPEGNMPPALTGGDRFDQYATANAIEKIGDHIQESEKGANAGSPVESVAMVPVLFKHIQKQNSTRLAAAQDRGMNIDSTDTASLAALKRPSKEVIEQLISDYVGHPVTITLVTETYSQKQLNGKSIKGLPYIPEDTYSLMRTGGEQSFVPTPEKGFRPGLFREHKVVETAPRQERSLVLGNMFPNVDPRDICFRKVL